MMVKGRRKSNSNDNTTGSDSKTADASPSDTTEVKVDEEEIQTDSQTSADTLEDIKASKEAADDINDVIMELEKMQVSEKEKTSDSSAESIQVATDSPQIEIEHKEERNEGHKDIGRSSEVVQNLSSNKRKLIVKQEKRDCTKNDKEGEEIPLKKRKTKNDMKVFMTLQKSKINEQVKYYRQAESELDQVVSSQNVFPSNEVSTKAESHEETRVNTGFEDRAIEQDISASEQNIELKKLQVSEKEKDFDNVAECIQVSTQSLQSVAEGKESERSNNAIQEFHSDKEKLLIREEIKACIQNVAEASTSNTTDTQIDDKKYAMSVQSTTSILEETKISKELADQANDFITELKRLETTKEANVSDSSAECNLVATQCPEDLTGNKKEGKKGKDIERSSDYVQNFSSDEETRTVTQEKDWMKKEKCGKNIPLIKSKFDNFIKLQNSKKNEKVSKHRQAESEIDQMMSRLNISPSEEIHKKDESHEKTEVKADLEDNAIKQDLSAAELNDEANKKEKNVGDSSAELIPVETQSPKKKRNKRKKDKKGKEIERSRDFVQNLSSDKETLTVAKEERDCMKSKEDKNSPLKRNSKHDMKNFMDLQISKMNEQVKHYRQAESELQMISEQNDFSSEGPTKSESHEETRVKTVEDNAIKRDVSASEPNDEANKKERNVGAGTAELIQIATQSPKKKRNKRKKDKKGKGKDIERSSDDVQNLSSDKETLTVAKEERDCRKNKEDQSSPLKRSAKHDMKNFMTRQISKMNEQVKHYRQAESELQMISEQNYFSSEGPTKAESHEETRVKRVEDTAIKQDVSAAEPDDKTNKRIIKLRRYDGVYFEFEANNNTIITGDNTDYKDEIFLDENQSVAFDFTDENIKVFFVGNLTYVFTKRNEFNITFRKSSRDNLVNKATQSDN